MTKRYHLFYTYECVKIALHGSQKLPYILLRFFTNPLKMIASNSVKIVYMTVVKESEVPVTLESPHPCFHGCLYFISSTSFLLFTRMLKISVKTVMSLWYVWFWLVESKKWKGKHSSQCWDYHNLAGTKSNDAYTSMATTLLVYYWTRKCWNRAINAKQLIVVHAIKPNDPSLIL